MNAVRRPGRAVMLGVISDTHGIVRPEALRALAGVEAILHAGDIGSADVLRALAAIAPVTAVRGNNDRGRWASAIPLTATVRVGEATIYLLHDRHTLDLDPRAAGVAVVVTGHSHRPGIERRDGVLYVNPGSAGPRRFDLPIAVARLRIVGSRVTARVVVLKIEPNARPRPGPRAAARRATRQCPVTRSGTTQRVRRSSRP